MLDFGKPDPDSEASAVERHRSIIPRPGAYARAKTSQSRMRGGSVAQQLVVTSEADRKFRVNNKAWTRALRAGLRTQRLDGTRSSGRAVLIVSTYRPSLREQSTASAVEQVPSGTIKQITATVAKSVSRWRWMRN
jgi:hypothetical protein